MRSQNKEIRSQKPEVRSQKLKSSFASYSLLIAILLSTVYCLLPTVISAAEKWSGVDESVIEKIAKEHGRETREPMINTDKGDLLLFVFLLAGAIGGFAAGYYWRMLSEHKRQTK